MAVDRHARRAQLLATPALFRITVELRPKRGPGSGPRGLRSDRDSKQEQSNTKGNITERGHFKRGKRGNIFKELLTMAALGIVLVQNDW